MSDALLSRLQINAGETPAYRQLAEQIGALIRCGELAPGERLPPDRALAQALGLSRTTVVTAYDELKSAGLVQGRQGSGTYVARAHGPGDGWSGLDALAPYSAAGGANRAGGTISLTHSVPPLEATPTATLARLLGEVAQEQPELLADYLPAEGYPPLRHELARLLTGWGIPARPAETIVLSGSQQGIDLIGRLLLRPGDYVAVEAHCYLGAHTAFRGTGARLLPVAIDADGMVVEELASLLSRYPVRLIYTVPTYHNPTGATLPLARREALLTVAARHSVPIVEDSPFDQLFFEAPPPPTLKALDRAGLVLYLSSASKLLCAGLRLGWLVASPSMIEQLATLKRSADVQANNFGQAALYRFLSAGLMPAHLQALRNACQRRATRLVAAIDERLPELSVRPPAGGVYAWGRLPPGLSAEAVLEEAVAGGVTFMPGSWFSVHGSDDGSLRLCFTNPPADQLAEAVARLAAAVRAVEARGGMPRGDRLRSQTALV